VVAGEDLLQGLGRGAGGDRFGSDEGVRVAVANHLQVHVIRYPAAGEHGVQLLPGLLPGSEPVHGVGGDALGGVDGGGVAEAYGGNDVIGWQPDSEVAASVPHGQVAFFADMGDGPAVAVFDPLGGGEAEPPVVDPGDDHISDTGSVPVGQGHFGCGSGVIETMPPGTAVEFGDQVPGGGDHDRVEPSRSIGNPSAERILSRGGPIADMDPAVIKVELECPWFAFSEGE
jgi:hypothetical protein